MFELTDWMLFLWPNVSCGLIVFMSGKMIWNKYFPCAYNTKDTVYSVQDAFFKLSGSAWLQKQINTFVRDVFQYSIILKSLKHIYQAINHVLSRKHSWLSRYSGSSKSFPWITLDSKFDKSAYAWQDWIVW